MASKRQIRRRACLGKRGYMSLRSAFDAQAGHCATFGETLGVYWCQWCHHYHLGHPPGPRRTRGNFKELHIN